jgi:hypothetical protein
MPDEEQRRGQLAPMARAEYDLSDEKLRGMTISRMRTLLAMETGAAKTIISSYDAVMRTLPGQAAMRRVSMVQTLVTEFTAEEEEKLRELIPTVFAGAPRRATGLEVPASQSFAVNRDQKKRSWWPFGH